LRGRVEKARRAVLSREVVSLQTASLSMQVYGTIIVHAHTTKENLEMVDSSQIDDKPENHSR
jgi:hypothetical protein